MWMNGRGAMLFPPEMGTSSWFGLGRAEEALDTFFHPTHGLTKTMEGSAGENSIPLGGQGRWLNGGSNCPFHVLC